MSKESSQPVVQLRGARTLGIISDTHGQIVGTQKAARMFDSFEVDAVLHCGDIGGVEIPPLLQAWPTHYVLGNVDWEREQLVAVIERAGGWLHGRFAGLSASGRRIAVTHGDDTDRLDRAILSGDWDLVCHGHTHIADQFQQGDTLVLNPGALQRVGQPSVAVVDLSSLGVTMIPLT